MRGSRPNLGVAENYTSAFLVSAFFLLIIILLAIWAVWGFLAVLFVGFLAERALRLEARRTRRE